MPFGQGSNTSQNTYGACGRTNFRNGAPSPLRFAHVLVRPIQVRNREDSGWGRVLRGRWDPFDFAVFSLGIRDGPGRTNLRFPTRWKFLRYRRELLSLIASSRADSR